MQKRLLLDRSRYAAQRRVQLGAEALHHGDNCNRDAGGDKEYSMAVAPVSSFTKRFNSCVISELHKEPHMAFFGVSAIGVAAPRRWSRS
jgi:hypothetical protein